MVKVAALLAAALTIVFHLFYFWPWELYFEPSAVVLAPIAAAAAVRLIERMPEGIVVRLVTAVFASGVLVAWASAHRPSARGSEGFQQVEKLAGIAATFSKNAPVTVLTGRNPAMVEAMTHARVLPVSRRVEYASKLVAPSYIPIEDPRGLSATDHRNPALAAGGAREAFPVTALEDLAAIEKEAAQGGVVLVDAATLLAEEASALREQFKVVDLASGVWRLEQGR